jgi:hypothetical protein
MLYSQHKEELKRYNITEEMIPQMMVSIASISVFPFAARGIIETILETTGTSFNSFIEKRKEVAAEFVIKAITK